MNTLSDYQINYNDDIENCISEKPLYAVDEDMFKKALEDILIEFGEVAIISILKNGKDIKVNWKKKEIITYEVVL